MNKGQTKPQQEQAETLRELGSRLRQVRLEQAMSIEEIATCTRIQPRLLKAIEEGNLELLPEPVYIRSLIKQFAGALGLNGAELAGRFPTSTNVQTVKPSWRQLPAAQLRPIHLYLLYILLVIASVKGLSYIIERSAQQASPVAPVLTPVERLLNRPTPQAEELPVTEAGSPPPQNSHQLIVELALRQESWLHVIADGKTQFEGILTAGDQRTWVAEEKLTLRAGNAGGVVVAVNEATPQPLGLPGQVREVTYQVQ